MARAEGVRNIGRLGERLVTLRESRGLPVAAVARATGISRSSLYQYETDSSANPTLESLLALAAFYELHSLEELFGPLPSNHLGALATLEESKNQRAG